MVTIIMVAVALVLTTFIAVMLNRAHNYLIPSIGTIRTHEVDVYGGSMITTQNGERQFNWGTIYTGTQKTRSLYIESKSNTKITLNFTTDNWRFRDSEGEDVTSLLVNYLGLKEAMNLKWNYTDTPIDPNAPIYITFTLKVSDNNSFINYLTDQGVTQFSFDIHIYAKE